MDTKSEPLFFGKNKKTSFEDSFSQNEDQQINNSEYRYDDFDTTNDNFVPLFKGEKVADIKNKNSNFIFFFGSAMSGKSVILSSLLYAMRTKFGVIRPNQSTPNSREAMVLLSDFFEDIRRGELPGRTLRDQVTRMDLIFEPNNKSKKVPPISLTFLEASGENHQEIKRGGKYHSSISQYLKAEIPMNFIIVTGYNTAHQEDTLISEFLFKLESEGKNLRSVNVVLVITKWDLSGNQKPSGEELEFFVRERLPMTSQFLETNGMDRTYYTIGELQKVAGKEKVVALNLEAAEILSKWLYKSIVGVDLDYEGTFWEQLKWSLGFK